MGFFLFLGTKNAMVQRQDLFTPLQFFSLIIFILLLFVTTIRNTGII